MNVGTIDQLIAVCEQMRNADIIGEYAIGGAFAATLLDEPIATADVDIFFVFSKESSSLVLDMTPIYDFAREQGFAFDHEFIKIHGWLVQFVESGTDPLWLDAIGSPRLIPVGNTSVPVIEPHFLVLMWLSAGRSKDFEKIARFVDAGLVTEEDFSVVERYGLALEWDKVRNRFFPR
ncbi:MAG TPA: hypothetical protein PKC65_03340 [Pyrinomonadaceae bacterium]|nr:hypothetical protein [Pyrinomonadaceae bacterium]